MKSIRYTLFILLAATAVGALAQDLSTEITVDRTVLPEQRAAERPFVLPTLLTTTTTASALQAAEYTQGGNIVNSLQTLPPAPWRASVEKSPYRGYVSAGYFPALNLGASAGYRFIDTDKASVGAEVQYDGTQFKRNHIKQRQNFLSAAIDGHLWADARSCLSGGFGYSFASVLHPPVSEDIDKFTQRANRVDIGVDWQSRVEGFAYNLGFSYQYFGLNHSQAWTILGGDPADFEDKKPRQSLVSFNGGFGVTREQTATSIPYRWLGIDFDGEFLTDNHEDSNLSQFHLDPFVRLIFEDFDVRVGAKFSIASGDFDTGLRVAPNVRADYRPADFPVAAWLEAGGGETLNPYSDLFAQNPYFAPLPTFSYTQGLGRTNTPISLGAGINIGQISGFSLSLYGRFAAVRNWYAWTQWGYQIVNGSAIPYNVIAYAEGSYQGFDANTWMVGGKIAYAYSNILEASVAVERGGSNHDYASWWEWQDRAKTRLKAQLGITPISALDINFGYALGASRHSYEAIVNEPISLGRAENLWVGATYRLTPAFSIFVRAENLTNASYLLVSGYDAQGVKGLAGISLKF